MKKFSYFTVLAVLSTSFTMPFLAVAAVADEEDCNIVGKTYDIITDTCVPIATSSGGININFIKPYSDSIIGIINSIFVPVLIAVAFIVFLWGVYKYFIFHGEEESAKMEGRKYAMWGIIGLAVIFSVWALVNILMGALNLQGGKPPPIPKL